MSRSLTPSVPLVLAIFAGLITPAPVGAQDWLTPHLESQRWNNLQRHQNRQRQNPAQGTCETPACTPDMVPQSDRQRIEAEYSRRVLTDGQPAAWAWSVQQGEAYRARLQAQGVCR